MSFEVRVPGFKFQLCNEPATRPRAISWLSSKSRFPHLQIRVNNSAYLRFRHAWLCFLNWYYCSKESIEKKKKNSPQYSFTIKEGVRWTRFSHWLRHPENELVINLDSSSDSMFSQLPQSQSSCDCWEGKAGCVKNLQVCSQITMRHWGTSSVQKFH